MKLLRLDVLIQDMATQKGKTPSEIREDLANHLGITERRLYQYRSAEIGDSVTIPLIEIGHIKEFFACTADDLFNSAAVETLK